MLFENQNVKLEVNTKDETVWLTLDNSVVAVFATTAKDGKKYNVQYYNIDIIISVGYHVKSKNGIIFRRWAKKILKDVLLKGYAVNQKRLEYLEKTIKLIDIAGRIDTELKDNDALEKNEGLKAIVGNIYQSFDGNDLYPTI